MKTLKSFLSSRMNRRLLGALVVFAAFLVVGCQDSVTNPQDSQPTNDQQAMQKIADSDSSLQSFDQDYNEEDLMSFDTMGKIQANIYPFRVGHRVRLVSRNLTIDEQGDTAYGKLTKNYEGVLLIEASYDAGATTPDTVIQKPFNSVVTRNLIFVKVANTDSPLRNWKLAAISLPEGGALNTNGTLSPNINITKLTVFLPSGDQIVIDSPNDYYLARYHGWLRWGDIPRIPRNSSVKVQVEVFSAYEDSDFVTITFGKNEFVGQRHKRKFDLVSSTQVAGGYDRVYEQTFMTYTFPGFYHAVINAFPKQVIFDDSTPVENSMWGIPYYVKLL